MTKNVTYCDVCGFELAAIPRIKSISSELGERRIPKLYSELEVELNGVLS